MKRRHFQDLQKSLHQPSTSCNVPLEVPEFDELQQTHEQSEVNYVGARYRVRSKMSKIAQGNR